MEGILVGSTLATGDGTYVNVLSCVNQNLCFIRKP